jgi:predicted AlkP superfamily pyrophosphatase or phosphodiesterase
MPPPGGNLTGNTLSPLNTTTTQTNTGRPASLLSPVEYDADAVSIRSDQDSDSDDDQLQQRARNSRELRAHDRMVFMEEEEADQLVLNARREQDRGRRRGSNLALANPLKFLGIRRYSDGSRSRSPDPPGEGRGGNGGGTTPRSTMTNATTLRASTSTDSFGAGEKTGGGGSSKTEKRRQRRQRRKDKKKRLLSQARDGEDAELMLEMEEGGMKEGSSTGDSSDRDDSDEVDQRGLAGLADIKGRRKRRSWGRWLLLHALIAVAFALLVLGAWKMTLVKKAEHQQQQDALKGDKPAKARTLVSNGTALFAPTTLIISLDGFRADFLNRGLTPRLNAFVREGVSPLYMLPSFPSVTFPNHYTLATGLYPECHGVVGNTFWDPEFKADFHYTDPNRSLDAKWWGGEPFWVTAERQRARTAIHMWPGSEAHILGLEPSYVDKYNGNEKLSKKVARILEFLDKPGLETAAADDVDGMHVPNLRPQLIAAYVPNVDSDGHRYGPNSTEIRGTIASVDSMLNDIFAGLEARNLTQIVNVIVVSDHGMATTDVSRLMQLEDLVDMDRIQHVDGWPLVGLRPKGDSADDLEALYQSVLNRTADNPNLEVYLRDVNMPERYHFSHNPRIAPLWLVPKAGWNIVQKSEFDVAEGLANDLVYHPRGLHGYDHEHPLMRAIFVARGPAFPHAPNSKLTPFQNIEVYNMLCDSIGIEPVANNGTLHLPLKPVGLHDAPPVEPEDPVPAYTKEPSSAVKTKTKATATATTTTVPQPIPTQKTATTSTSTSSSGASSSLSSQPSSSPAPNGDKGDKNPLNKVADAAGDLWDWITGKIGDAWSKIKGHGGDADDKDASDEAAAGSKE